MNDIIVSRVAANVKALGYGNRHAIWVHGCQIQCPGCCSRDTWQGKGQRIPIDKIIAWWKSQHSPVHGLTISGGEPSEQAAAVVELIDAFRSAYREVEVDVLLFSGRPYHHLERHCASLVAGCDVISAGPFVANLPPKPLRGSSNQTLHMLSELGRRRYGDVESLPQSTSTMQAVFHRDSVTTIGIPNSNFLSRLGSAECFDQRRSSWVSEKSV